MSLTNFGALTDEQLTVWRRDTWAEARTLSFVNRFIGDSNNSLIQRISDLKKTAKGARAVITLLADLQGDGVAGDRTLEGNEEAMRAYDQVIRIDQLRNATRHEGRMADQKSVVTFRGEAKDKLSYWLANKMDEMTFLAMSGVPFSMHNNGRVRTGSDLINLEFAQDIKPPTSKRRLRWNGTSKALEVGKGTTDIAAGDTPMWELFVQAKAYAKTHGIRGVNESGEPVYHAFLSPQAMAKLKLDPTYMQNLRHAQERSDKNELFTGSTVKIDGIYLHDYEHVYNTYGASGAVAIPGGGPAHSKWGATGDVDGCQILFCGAQSLAFADLGYPYWDEKGFDYENSQGISIGKIMGMLSPQLHSSRDGSVEDFGKLSIYVAQ